MNYLHPEKESMKSQMLKMIFRLSFLKKIIASDKSSKFVNYIHIPLPPRSLFRDMKVKKMSVYGKHVFTISPKENRSDTILLYLHGGAFFLNFTRPHWKLIHQLISETNCTIVAPDYPLLPEATYDERLAMVKAVYKHILREESGKKIIIAGDSSGGNLALALAETLHEENISTPTQIILLSPWLDVAMDNPDIRAVEHTDPVLSLEGAIRTGKYHAGNQHTKNYQVSPLYGNFANTGMISVFTGTADLLNPDARRLRDIAESRHIAINFFEYPDMVHAWMLFGLPESRTAIQQIIKLIREN